jgi:hypothetical protein
MRFVKRLRDGCVCPKVVGGKYVAWRMLMKEISLKDDRCCHLGCYLEALRNSDVLQGDPHPL